MSSRLREGKIIIGKFTKRIARGTDLMQKNGFDALILTKPANMFYLTGDSRLCAYIMVTKEGKVAMGVPQTDIADVKQKARADFMNIWESELKQAKEMSTICNDEWCLATESFIDDMHKSLYSISEPRWLSTEDSKRLKDLRAKIRDLYREFAHIKSAHA